jgi:hypothetical protein
MQRQMETFAQMVCAQLQTLQAQVCEKEKTPLFPPAIVDERRLLELQESQVAAQERAEGLILTLQERQIVLQQEAQDRTETLMTALLERQLVQQHESQVKMEERLMARQSEVARSAIELLVVSQNTKMDVRLAELQGKTMEATHEQLKLHKQESQEVAEKGVLTLRTELAAQLSEVHKALAALAPPTTTPSRPTTSPSTPPINSPGANSSTSRPPKGAFGGFRSNAPSFVPPFHPKGASPFHRHLASSEGVETDFVQLEGLSADDTATLMDSGLVSIPKDQWEGYTQLSAIRERDARVQASFERAEYFSQNEEARVNLTFPSLEWSMRQMMVRLGKGDLKDNQRSTKALLQLPPKLGMWSM